MHADCEQELFSNVIDYNLTNITTALLGQKNKGNWKHDVMPATIHNSNRHSQSQHSQLQAPEASISTALALKHFATAEAQTLFPEGRVLRVDNLVEQNTQWRQAAVQANIIFLSACKYLSQLNLVKQYRVYQTEIPRAPRC